MEYLKKSSDDRRVRRTKKLLKDSLASLLTEKNINDITVKEIVDLADLNRGTFYLHYKDIYDMLNQIENEMISNLNEIADKFPGSVLKGTPKPYIEELFLYIKENQQFCRMLLGSQGDIAFVEKLKKMVEEKCFRSIMEVCPQKELQNYQFFATYAVSGCIGLLQDWMGNGMKITPEQLAQVADDLIQNGICFLHNTNDRLK
ncbi:MAG TPA: TetR/AcrR family transcriptional regulator [Bacillota bacterium]|nr:TetR/AcrR family transcriptional regulator [Bacillota bacterium]